MNKQPTIFDQIMTHKFSNWIEIQSDPTRTQTLSQTSRRNPQVFLQI